MYKMFEAKTVREIVGISQFVLNQWIARKQIIPSIKATGTGSRNLFSAVRICQTILFKKLSSLHIHQEGCSKYAFDLKTEGAFELLLLPKNENYLIDYPKGTWKKVKSESETDLPVAMIFRKDQKGNMDAEYIGTDDFISTVAPRLIENEPLFIIPLLGIARDVRKALDERSREFVRKGGYPIKG